MLRQIYFLWRQKISLLPNQNDTVDYNDWSSAAFEQEVPHCIFGYSLLLVLRLNLEIHTHLHRTIEIFKGAGLRIKLGTICSRVEHLSLKLCFVMGLLFFQFIFKKKTRRNIYYWNFFWYGRLWLLLLLSCSPIFLLNIYHWNFVLVWVSVAAATAKYSDPRYTVNFCTVPAGWYHWTFVLVHMGVCGCCYCRPARRLKDEPGQVRSPKWLSRWTPWRTSRPASTRSSWASWGEHSVNLEIDQSYSWRTQKESIWEKLRNLR